MKHFLDLISFITMPCNNHYTGIIIYNINNNSLYDYYYDGIHNGEIIKKQDTLKILLFNYNIYMVIYHKISD